MRMLVWAILIALAILACPPCGADTADEFVRVAPDRWSFETAKAHQRFVPFGSNLVLTSKDDLDIFGPRYDSKRYDGILAACEGQSINLLKVFLPLGKVLPDPQTSGSARIAPGYLENLDDFLALCRKHHIRAVVSLAEWGGNDCKWWQEGGQYFGRKPWKTDEGPDSLDILAHFWTVLGKRLHDNPAVFSYTPVVEWTFPASNLTYFPETVQHGVLPNDVGKWYWRQWLLAKYGHMHALNAAWQSNYVSLDQVPVVDYSYDEAKHRYADPERAILDYQNFREWATLRYLRPQTAAIRAADPNHMVTISNHMRQWDLWEGAARYFMGFTAFEEKPLVDYVTHHANFDEGELASGKSVADLVRWTQVLARFCYAGRPMPVMIEEFSFASADQAKTAEAQAALVRGTIGHASGWTTWYLQYPSDPNSADAADKTHTSAWFDAGFGPTPWGRAAKSLRAQLLKADLKRIPPKTRLSLKRDKELVPHETGTLLRVARELAESKQPVDYVVEHEPDLDIRLPGDR